MRDATETPATREPAAQTECPAPSERAFTAFVIPHAHWDREWHQPFQVFRARLIDVIDAVLDIFDSDPEYRRFTLDGQAIVIEDYLEIRPERREDLTRHVRSGRLRIGPWYVLADEFLVSPEALVRNLALGRKTCLPFGEPMPVAYTPDSFGHVSQLPLLASGFGLNAIVFERGVGDEGERLRGEFTWVAADGRTRVLAVHLLGTYSAATALGHGDWELRDAYDRERAIEHVRAALYGFKTAPRDLPAWLRESFERVHQGLTGYSTNGALFLLNGSDHLFPQRNIPSVLDDLNEAFPDVCFVHADVEEAVAAARLPLDDLQAYQGEFRGSRYQHVLSGVLSTRLYLKQANHRAETLLERFTEPLATLAWLAGAPYPAALLESAWRLLLKNHPHDSICGCSVDPVHREMMTRFEGVEQLGGDLVSRAAGHLAGGSGTGAVAVFNPHPFPVEALCQADIELPHPQAHKLIDTSGREVTSHLAPGTEPAPGQAAGERGRARLAFLAALPPLSLSTYRLVAGRAAGSSSLLRAERKGQTFTLDNPHLTVEIGPGGLLTLAHKESGRKQALGIELEDQGDAGDEYDFSPVPGDTPIRFSSPRDLALTAASPLSATVTLRYELKVPRHLSAGRRGRSGRATIPLALALTLTATARRVDLRVGLENRAMDHRLRLRLKTGIDTSRVWADGHFDVLERPLRPPEGADWFQKPQPASHQRLFLAVSDGTDGLALFNRGLPEYEAGPGEAGVDLAVTLLRCVGWLSRGDLASRPQGAGPSLATPEAQCPGAHDYDLALYPFTGPWWESGVVAEAETFAAPPRPLPAGATATAAQLLSLTAPFRLTCLKRADGRDSVIARIHNPAPVALTGRLELGIEVREAHVVRLDETRLERIEPSRSFELALGPKEVRTLELKLAGKEV
jgi:mannosylglycerate hydrolase